MRMKITVFAFTKTNIFTKGLLSITIDEMLYATQDALLKNHTLT